MGGQGREADPRQDEIAGVVDDQGQVALAGGGVSRPSRCMRSRATRALISLSPSSGLRQSSASQTACCISLCFDKILQIIPMQGRGTLWISSLLQERVTVASLTETYGSTGPLPGLNSLLQ